MRFAKQLPIGRTDLRFEVETTRKKKSKEENESNRKLYVGVRTIGVLGLLMLAAIAWLMVTRDFKPRSIADVANSPHHLSGPVLALEFIQTPDQLKTILGTEAEHNARELRDDIRRDYFFIATYALLYIALSLLLAHRHQRRWAIYLAWVAAICGIGAALFDVRENLAMAQLLNAPAPTQQIVNAIHFAAIVKWTLTFITAAILALNFYASDGWLMVIGFALRLTALLGLVGLWYVPLLQWALLPMLVGLILLIIRALFQPQKFIEEL
jgi:hypothetical protein